MLTDITICILTAQYDSSLHKLLQSIQEYAPKILIVNTGTDDFEAHVNFPGQTSIVNIPLKNNFSSVRNEALKAVHSQWVWMVDTDETIPETVWQEVDTVLSESAGIQAVQIPRKNYYFGKWLKYGGHYPDYQIKIFRTEGTVYTKMLHEKLQIDGAVRKISNPIKHYPYETINDYIQKFQLYTTIEARILLEKNVSINILNTIRWCFCKPVVRFIKRYFLKGGLLNGMAGLIACLGDAYRYPVQYFKYWELLNNG